MNYFAQHMGNTIRYFIDNQGQRFRVRRGPEEHEVRGLPVRAKDNKDAYISFLPDADVATGDLLTGLVSEKTFEITNLEKHVIGDDCIEIKAYYHDGRRGVPRRSVRNTIHFGTASNVIVQQDSPAGIQNVNIASGSLGDVSALLSVLRSIVEIDGLPEAERAEIVDDVETIEKEAKRSRPRTAIVKECLRGVKGSLENVAARAIGTGMGTVVSERINQLATFLVQL